MISYRKDGGCGFLRMFWFFESVLLGLSTGSGYKKCNTSAGGQSGFKRNSGSDFLTINEGEHKINHLK